MFSDFSLNFLPSDEDLQKTFEGIARSLHPKGAAFMQVAVSREHRLLDYADRLLRAKGFRYPDGTKGEAIDHPVTEETYYLRPWEAYEAAAARAGLVISDIRKTYPRGDFWKYQGFPDMQTYFFELRRAETKE
jgi:hypothetical protein